ncbi:MAG: enoyl-CoA hydratase/isomerase family protein [Pseudomonadota bacterium]|jgi:enoyl-CoA hydratase/carnithine racemase
MSTFAEYATRYRHIRLERDEDGVLVATFHTDGGTLQWGPGPYQEFPRCFADIGNDRGNKVVIFTGAGDDFSGPPGNPSNHRPRKTPSGWYNEYWGGKRLVSNLLDIEVPTIAAINGPAFRHSELPLLCDLVIGSDTVAFQDTGHFMTGLVPGDGVHVIYPTLLGLNRGRYFLMTGQRIDAQEALNLGLVCELLPRERLLARARELAALMLRQPPLVRRFTKALLVQQLKRSFHETLGYGLSIEGMAVVEGWDKPEEPEF